MRKLRPEDILYNKEKSALEFNFDTLLAPSMFNFITMNDIYFLHGLAKDIKLASKINYKYKQIAELMKARGFRKIGAGTNRVVYQHYECPSTVLKIAIDKVGLGDNPREFQNQHLLKPFVTKMFECSPCGTVAWCEYAYPITNMHEFKSVAEDIFNLITKKVVGKYILEDIGTKYFMNWALRANGFGPVLLDYPYIYKLDGAKLYCNKPSVVDPNFVCDGLIDYDDGFNGLVCTRCGRTYNAVDLEDKSQDIKIIINKDMEEVKMKIKITNGGTTQEYNTSATAAIDSKDSVDITAAKMIEKITIKDMKIPKRMKTVNIEKEKKDKVNNVNKAAKKVADNLNNVFHKTNDGRFVEPDYSNYEVKHEDLQTYQQDNNVIEVDYEKDFGLKPLRENHKKMSGANPYLDNM